MRVFRNVEKSQPLFWPNLLATKPGCRQFAVTFGPLQQRREVVGEEDVGELALLIGAPTAIALRPLRVLQVHLRPAMGLGGHVDDAGRGARLQTLQQEPG